MNYLNKIKVYILEECKGILPAQKLRTPFIILCCIYGLSVLPIIRANYNYLDDIGRTIDGYRMWGWLSRYLNNYLAAFIHTGRHITDISPLPQLIAVVLLALSSVILIHLFSDEKKISYGTVIAATPIGLFPYFLECLSFKYDSPYMALSLLASVAPVLFIDRDEKTYFAATFLCILVMCTTYQAASGIFVITVLFLLFKRWNGGENSKKIMRSGAVSAAAYLFALLFFKIFLLKTIRSGSHVTASLPAPESLPYIIGKNGLKYFRLIASDFPYLWRVLFVVLLSAFLYTAIVNSSRKKSIAAVMAILLLLFSSVLSYGIYIVLEKALFEPRAMFGFGAFTALMTLCIATDRIWQKKTIKCVTLYMCWCLFVFSFTYGNALAEQKEYSLFRIQLALADLTRVLNFNGPQKYKMQITGNIKHAPVVRNMEKRCAVLSRLTRSLMPGGGGISFRRYYFFKYTDLPNVDDVTEYNKRSKIDFRKEKLPILYDNCYHTISAKDHKILIRLK